MTCADSVKVVSSRSGQHDGFSLSSAHATQYEVSLGMLSLLQGGEHQK